MIDIDFESKASIGFRFVFDMMEADSPYGAEYIKKPPVYDEASADELETELNNVERAIATFADFKHDYSLIERTMMTMKDIRKTLSRMRDASLDNVELFELKRFLLQLERIAPAYARLNEAARFSGIEIAADTEALDILDCDGTRTATFMISDRMSDALKRIRDEKRGIELKIRMSGSASEAERLKAERTVIAAREQEEEARIRREITTRLEPHVKTIERYIDGIGRLDFTIARARLAMRFNAAKPSLGGESVELMGMTNPMIAEALESRGKRFMPVSVRFERGTTVITGANMGGKSVSMKTAVLNVLLAHCGMYVFAKSAKIPYFDGMHIVAEDMEDSRRGLSSFGAEIVELSKTVELAHGERRSLIILDELARGTNPDEGARIVQGTVKSLSRLNAVSVLTTHYDGVAQFATKHYRVVGLKNIDERLMKERIAARGESGVSVIEDCMDYRLEEMDGECPVPQDALKICEMLSIDGELLDDIRGAY